MESVLDKVLWAVIGGATVYILSAVGVIRYKSLK